MKAFILFCILDHVFCIARSAKYARALMELASCLDFIDIEKQRWTHTWISPPAWKIMKGKLVANDFSMQAFVHTHVLLSKGSACVAIPHPSWSWSWSVEALDTLDTLFIKPSGSGQTDKLLHKKQLWALGRRQSTLDNMAGCCNYKACRQGLLVVTILTFIFSIVFVGVGSVSVSYGEERKNCLIPPKTCNEFEVMGFMQPVTYHHLLCACMPR